MGLVVACWRRMPEVTIVVVGGGSVVIAGGGGGGGTACIEAYIGMMRGRWWRQRHVGATFGRTSRCGGGGKGSLCMRVMAVALVNSMAEAAVGGDGLRKKTTGTPAERRMPSVTPHPAPPPCRDAGVRSTPPLLKLP